MNDTDTFFHFENDLLTELHAVRARSAAAPAGPTMPRRRRRRLVAVAAGGAVVAAAVVAVAVVNTGGTSAKPAAAAAGGLPSSSSVRNAVLAAFDANGGDVAYTHMVRAARGEPRVVQDMWQSPSRAATGTRVHFRSRITFGGTVGQDVGMIWTQPGGSSARKTVTGEMIDVEYGSRTWSDQEATPLASGGVFGADQVRQEIAQGYLRVDGPATVGGKKAIKLSLRLPGAGGVTSVLWVDASTYLPIESVAHRPGKTPETTTTDYQMLPSTPGNMASLNVPVPAGFTRTATPPAYPRG